METTETGHYGLLMVMPPSAASQIDNTPREIIFVIDTSGSMGGESIRQAKSALIHAIRRLQQGDSFNVIQFNSDTDKLFTRSVRADDRNKQQAIDYVSSLSADGGTEMLSALKAALTMEGQQSRLRQVVFITDGAVGNERELFSYIQKGVNLSNRQQRLFTVGIGSAPNSFFMTEAAYFGSGTYTYIQKTDEVAARMTALFNQLEHPVLTNPEIKLEVGSDVLPNPMPDLYFDEPLVAVMKLDEKPDQVLLSGRFGRAQWTHRVDLKNEASQSGLAVYWAREKIRHWMRKKVQGEDEQMVRQKVLDIALKNHLVSRYTSLVAVDVTPVRVKEELLRRQALDGELPAGYSTKTVTLARTATSSRWYLLLGMLSIMLALVITLSSRLEVPRGFR